MKKILILILLVLCCTSPVWSGEFEDTLKKAEQGDAWAQYNLGNMYRQGIGVQQDYKQAVYWYTQAAEQSVAEAQYNLGVCIMTAKESHKIINLLMFGRVWQQRKGMN